MEGRCVLQENGLPETVEDYFRFLIKVHIFLDKIFISGIFSRRMDFRQITGMVSVF